MAAAARPTPFARSLTSNIGSARTSMAPPRLRQWKRIWFGRGAGASLTLCSGYLNMCTLLRFGTVGGPMTGNTIRLGGMLALEGETASAAGLMLLGFYVGGVITLFVLDVSKHLPSFIAAVTPVVLISGALILSDGLALVYASEPLETRRLVTSLTAFSLGGQNIISGRAPSLGANTTFMTGTVKRISEGSYALLLGDLKDAKERDTLVLLCLLWTCTAAGAAIGACAADSESHLLTDWPLLPAVPVQALTLLLLRWKDPEKRVGPRRPRLRRLSVITPAGSVANSRDSSPERAPKQQAASVAAAHEDDGNDDGQEVGGREPPRGPPRRPPAVGREGEQSAALVAQREADAAAAAKKLVGGETVVMPFNEVQDESASPPGASAAKSSPS